MVTLKWSFIALISFLASMHFLLYGERTLLNKFVFVMTSTITIAIVLSLCGVFRLFDKKESAATVAEVDDSLNWTTLGVTKSRIDYYEPSPIKDIVIGPKGTEQDLIPPTATQELANFLVTVGYDAHTKHGLGLYTIVKSIGVFGSVDASKWFLVRDENVPDFNSGLAFHSLRVNLEAFKYFKVTGLSNTNGGEQVDAWVIGRK